jgi:hypothetical protein
MASAVLPLPGALSSNEEDSATCHLFRLDELNNPAGCFSSGNPLVSLGAGDILDGDATRHCEMTDLERNGKVVR